MYLSILIRNLNESKSLRQTLLALQKQVTDFEYEVIVIDNESDDDSVIVAEKMGCKVVTLKRSAFTYGHALNYGIAKCSGEIILVLSSHVILLNEYFLKNIPQYFEDENVAALRFVNSVMPEHVIESIANGAQQLVYDEEANFAGKHWTHFIVNHCAAIRKSCWNEVPFDEVIFASEDKIWSLEVIKRGYALLYNAPCFYVYTKQFNRTAKIKRSVIEAAAKEMITGTVEPLFIRPYVYALLKKIRIEFKRFLTDIKIHRQVYNGIKKYRKN